MNKPNPDRIYAVIAQILERRHGVKIEYALTSKEDMHEQHDYLRAASR